MILLLLGRPILLILGPLSFILALYFSHYKKSRKKNKHTFF
ncbi:hypothetical protein [Veillonella parvula]